MPKKRKTRHTYLKGVRVFDRKSYRLEATSRSKRNAAKLARLRRKQGWFARVIKRQYKGKPLYVVYVSWNTKAQWRNN